MGISKKNQLVAEKGKKATKKAKILIFYKMYLWICYLLLILK